MKIAILGMGNIGSGVVDTLLKNNDEIKDACGSPVEIKYILDLREFPGHVLEKAVVHDISIIINDSEIELVAEMMGGLHPAFEFSKAALAAGKHVVTSNKELVAVYGVELTTLAAENNVHYLFEGSVGGGIPLLRSLTEALAAETIHSVNGILNGTTNYILSNISKGTNDFDEVLAEAKALGYAEPDPTADIKAYDSQRKICILTALITGKLPPVNKITAEEINTVTPNDIASAIDCGGTIKLISHFSLENGKADVFAAPCFVYNESPLAHVDGVFNGVMVDASLSGELMFFGRGAGKYPTAGSITADITAIARGTQAPLTPFVPADDDFLLDSNEHSCRHFLCVPTEIKDTAAKAFSITSKPNLCFGSASYILDEMPHGEAVRIAEQLKDLTKSHVALYRII